MVGPIIVFLVLFIFFLYWKFGRATVGTSLAGLGELFSLKRRWGDKSEEQQLWFLYSSLAVIAILVAYLTPEDIGATRYKIMGGVVLIVLHVVIWPFFLKKTSATTKFFVSTFLVFCAFAFVFPNTADKTWKDTKKWAENFDRNDEEEKETILTSKKEVPSMKTMFKENITTVLEPGVMENVVWPKKARRIDDLTWSCPHGCFVGIEHIIRKNETPVCIEKIYREYACTSEIISQNRDGDYIVKEVFLNPPGQGVPLPHNLRGFFINFSTISGIRASISYTIRYST